MEEEVWREIPEYPDYQISNLGQVKSFKRGKERILKPSKDKSGHLLVCLCNGTEKKTFNIHRVLGIVFLGFPENKEVDHINGDPADNRLENLRPCARGENSMNRRKQSNNTTGFPGVDFHKTSGKYRARIKINGKNKHLGYFDSPEEAFIAYRDANLELFAEFSPFVCRAEFKALSDRVEALSDRVEALEGAV